ncbi:MAG: sulfate/molybdate ABC transporter ATP-binding protein [Caulobacteraceae bacterium]|nr:sulfate/molybdate ABC transporter ATP-binding protein [Caulobacteraceae bacterium]
MTITIRAVDKRFGRYPALNNIGLEVRDGELLALLGPSGSGKTTLLRVIAGLEFPEAGQVLFGGQDVTYAHAAARQVGFVFQQYALFKHMTVAKNVAFGLDVRKAADRPSKADIAARVAELLKLVELDGLGGRFPSQLSGGQRQRVALARALAVSPQVLLLDEPFGALDATVRKSLRRELRRIHDATGVTTIFVTHDQEEALELADRVAILNKGQIEQVGAPQEVHDNPASAFVCGFVGEANRLVGEVTQGRFRSGAIQVPAPGVAPGAASAYIRPYDIVAGAPGEGFEATVRRIVLHGPVARVETVLDGGQPIEASFAREDLNGAVQGGRVTLKIKQAHLFPVVQG